jgi:hypothetical protein
VQDVCPHTSGFRTRTRALQVITGKDWGIYGSLLERVYMHFEARISVQIGVHTVPGVSYSAHASYTVQFSLSSVSSVQFNLTPTFPRQRLDALQTIGAPSFWEFTNSRI